MVGQQLRMFSITQIHHELKYCKQLQAATYLTLIVSATIVFTQHQRVLLLSPKADAYFTVSSIVYLNTAVKCAQPVPQAVDDSVYTMVFYSSVYYLILGYHVSKGAHRISSGVGNEGSKGRKSLRGPWTESQWGLGSSSQS